MSNARYLMDLDLTRFQTLADSGVAAINLSDYRGLGELLWQADQGTVDEEGQSVESSIQELKETLEGKYGQFLEKCSFKIVDDGAIIAAVVITFYPRENLPLVAFTMTQPNMKNRGLCQRLLKCSASALLAEGYSKCFLAVTAANIPAVKAYEKVGFVIRR